MKRIIMLKPMNCGAADTYKGKIYDIIKDIWCVVDEQTENESEHKYNNENLVKYPKGIRCIKIRDESSEDCFEVYKDDDRFILCENDRELAHKLIDTIDGLDIAIINMALSLNHK